MKVKNVANIITAINLIAGVVSLILVMSENYPLAAAMVLLAALLDSMDGRVARHLQVTSDFGKELDSLADLVSFGVAPAILAHTMVLVPLGLPGLAVTIIFVVCGALRLARYNTTSFSGSYEGMPITAAGGLVALLMLVSVDFHSGIILLVMLSLSFLMVSKISVPKF